MYIKSVFALFGISIVLMLSIAGYAYFKMQPPKAGGDFTLKFKEQSWNFNAQKKRLNLLYFGYTVCPDVCPMALSAAADAISKLEPETRSQIQFIFVNVDSENVEETSAANYVTNFNPDFIGLGGNKSEIRRVLDLYGASFIEEKNPNSYLGYSISHTDRLFFLDELGQVVDTISNPSSSDIIYKKIKENI